MATVKGLWKFNTVPTVTFIGEHLWEDVNFISNGLDCTCIIYEQSGGTNTEIVYIAYAYNTSSRVTPYRHTSGWESDAYRTIDFGTTEQTVTEEFYTWLTASAMQQSSGDDGDSIPVATITYGGEEVTTLSASEIVTLHTSGKRLAGDVEIVITAKDYDGDVEVTGEPNSPGEGGTLLLQEKTITENGEYTPDEGYDGLSKVTVDVPIPEGYIVPSGTLPIAENGTYDVTDYASVTVNVPTETVEEYDGTVIISPAIKHSIVISMPYGGPTTFEHYDKSGNLINSQSCTYGAVLTFEEVASTDYILTNPTYAHCFVEGTPVNCEYERPSNGTLRIYNVTGEAAITINNSEEN